MSSTILVDGNQTKVANAALGLNTDRVADVNKSLFSSGYEWYEPNEGFIGYLYPELWHPLYGENRMSDILSQTISLQNKLQSDGLSQQDAMKKATEKVGYVVKQYPYRRELTGMSRWGIAVLICVIIMLTIHYFYGKNTWYYIFVIIGIISILNIIYHLYKYLIPARAESQKLWSTYTSYVDASGYSGSNLNAILSDTRKKEDQANLIMAQQNVSGQSPIGFSSGLGAGLGAGLGSGLSSIINNSISGMLKK